MIKTGAQQEKGNTRIAEFWSYLSGLSIQFDKLDVTA